MRSNKLFIAVFFIALASLFAHPTFAQPATTRAGAGQLIEFKLSSSALKNNLLGDSAEQDIAVYLPPSYQTSPAKRFPTLYLLHGFTGTITAWTRNGYQGMSLQPLMDGLIKEGKIREMIVVVPNGRNSYGGGFYTNSTVTGNWEDYIYRDLVSHIDATYRTLARAESRGIAGHSMGGYGALVLGMKHPEVFSAIYALSPCCVALEADMSDENPAWKTTIRLSSKDELRLPPKSLAHFYSLAYVALGASFSPNRERAPFFVDFPYQERDGRLERNEPAYTRWRAKMPLYMIEENKANLQKLRGLFLDYGEREEFSHIRLSTALFSKALAERNIPHMFEVYAGGDHGNKIRERLETRVLQFFSDKLDFPNSK